MKQAFKIAKETKEKVREFLYNYITEKSAEENKTKFEICDELEKEIIINDLKLNLFLEIRCFEHKNKYYIEPVFCSQMELWVNGITEIGKEVIKKLDEIEYESELYEELNDMQDYCKFTILDRDNYYYMNPNTKLWELNCK
jgi:hypothetical protein